MLKKSLATHAALGLLLLSIGCGDDAKDKDLDEAAGDGSVTGVIGNRDGGPSVSRPDGGTDLDGGNTDLDGALGNDTDPQVGPDGAILPGDTSDAGGGGNTSSDASSGLDGAVADAGTPQGSAPDAASPAGDAGCAINDPSFGCGVAITPTWVRFGNGYEYDSTEKLLWAPARVPTNPMMLSEECFPVDLGGVQHIFDIPMMNQVRTLAAGCAATLSATSASCKVNTDQVLPSQAGACACEGSGAGPHASGGFCRPEVSTCETLWTRTYCGSNDECPTHRGWFYDVSNGSIVVTEFDKPLATGAKFRCVTKVDLALN